MAYEVESIAPTVTPTDASIASSPVMREARVVEPYRQRSMPAVKESGQVNTNDTSTQAAPAETKATPPAETVALSPQMAALARKEQAFRRQQQQLKTEREALEREKAEVAEFKALKQGLANRDFSEVEKHVPYNEYTEYLISKGTETTPEQQALKNVELKLQKLEDARKTDIDRRFDAAIAERKRAAVALVESSPEFSGIKKLKQEDAVVQHILDTWEEDSVELTVEQAAKEVETALREQATQWASIIETEAKPPVEEKNPLPPMRQGTKTLTNEMTIQGEAKPQRKSFQGMTDAERWAEARRRAEEKLPKRG